MRFASHVWIFVTALALFSTGGCANLPAAPSGTGGELGGGGVAGQGGSLGGGGGGGGGEAGTAGHAGAGGGGGQDSQTSEDLLVWCTSNVTPSSGETMPWTLSVVPTPIVGGEGFAASVGGTALFNEAFLDIAQVLIVDGVRRVHVSEFNTTVVPLAGATGPDVVLTHASTDYTCALDDSPGDGPSCDPANDVGADGANLDCQPFGANNSCGVIIELPISDDCSPGGVCAEVGSAGGLCDSGEFCKEQAGRQCELNGFCVTGALEVPLSAGSADYVADSTGEVRFGFAFDTPWNYPISDSLFPASQIGLRFTVGGLEDLPLSIDCVPISEDEPGGAPPASELLVFPIGAGCEDESQLCPAGFAASSEDKCVHAAVAPRIVLEDPLGLACQAPSTLRSRAAPSDLRVLESPSLLVKAAVRAANLTMQYCAAGAEVVATIGYRDSDFKVVTDDAIVFALDNEVTVSAIAPGIVETEIAPLTPWSVSTEVCCVREFQTTFTYSVDQCEGW